MIVAVMDDAGGEIGCSAEPSMRSFGGRGAGESLADWTAADPRLLRAILR